MLKAVECRVLWDQVSDSFYLLGGNRSLHISSREAAVGLATLVPLLVLDPKYSDEIVLRKHDALLSLDSRFAKVLVDIGGEQRELELDTNDAAVPVTWLSGCYNDQWISPGAEIMVHGGKSLVIHTYLPPVPDAPPRTLTITGGGKEYSYKIGRNVSTACGPVLLEGPSCKAVVDIDGVESRNSDKRKLGVVVSSISVDGASCKPWKQPKLRMLY